MQNVRPESLTDKELFHYAACMRENDNAVPQNWVDEMIRRYFSGNLQVPSPRFQD